MLTDLLFLIQKSPQSPKINIKWSGRMFALAGDSLMCTFSYSEVLSYWEHTCLLKYLNVSHSFMPHNYLPEKVSSEKLLLTHRDHGNPPSLQVILNNYYHACCLLSPLSSFYRVVNFDRFRSHVSRFCLLKHICVYNIYIMYYILFIISI